MKNKAAIVIFLIMLVFTASCKQVVKQDTAKAETPEVETTGDAAVDSVGKDLNNVDSIEEDLSIDELNNLDSGLQDIQNI